MNMKNLVLSFAILTSVLSFAQQREDRNLRGERKRVAQGIKSGEIKPREAVAIEKQARDVKQAKRARFSRWTNHCKRKSKNC
jgi:hypothetical protein